MSINNYFNNLIQKYIKLFIVDDDLIVGFNPRNKFFRNFSNAKWVLTSEHYCSSIFNYIEFEELELNKPKYILLGDTLHEERDVQNFLRRLQKICKNETRIFIHYYSHLWKPLFFLAKLINKKRIHVIPNWLTHSDMESLLFLEGYEIISAQPKILVPIYIPIISNFVNRFIAPLPFICNFCLLNIAVVRSLKESDKNEKSVSVIVPARNEAGNIKEIIRRIPKMGSNDEIIFVEGGSSDGTWEVIIQECENNNTKNISFYRQSGRGKGDAVRLGFMKAKNDVLIILDADMTVCPEDLPKFYEVICKNKAEFVNGSRLVYPMEKKAMRFMNLIGNKFFALSFSFVLGQPLKDTLCGTKVISKINYERLALGRLYFGDFDPFGDFDLILGASRMGLKMVEVPVQYKARVYGETNISRWKHGLILLMMLLFSAKKLRFI